MRQAVNQNTVSFLTGAGLGAAAMYLFDPQEGPYRRHHLAETASDTAHRTGEALSSAWHAVREGTVEYGQAAGKGVRTLGHRLGEGASHVADSRWGSGIRRGSSRLASESSSRFQAMLHGRQAVGAERLGLDSGLAQALVAVGVLALGAGAMYLLDPRAGARRRAVARDKFVSGFGWMCSQLDKKSRNLMNHLRGSAAEVRGRLRPEEVTDRVMVERVRSNIGRCVSNASAINVEAHGGRITISGPVLASEVDSLLKCVWSTRGTTELVNRMEVHERADIPSLQGSRQTASNPGSTMGGSCI